MIVNFALAYRTPLQLDILKEAILQALEGRTFRTFRCRLSAPSRPSR